MKVSLTKSDLPFLIYYQIPVASFLTMSTIPAMISSGKATAISPEQAIITRNAGNSIIETTTFAIPHVALRAKNTILITKVMRQIVNSKVIIFLSSENLAWFVLLMGKIIF